MNYIAIHGRQPELGIAEVEALLGPAHIEPITHEATILKKSLNFERLGSTVKVGKILEKTPVVPIKDMINFSLEYILDNRKHRQGKLQLGVSVYGKRIHHTEINRAALGLKKKLRSKGMSVRLVPNKHTSLNAAQVLNNKLHRENGIEIMIIYSEDSVYLAQGVHVQDIDEYARRDREKPVRDSLVGMLPPKLAQTLINLTNPDVSHTVLDPFCGSGTVLMEANAMGLSSYGTDLSPAMIEASQLNMEWFTKNLNKPPKYWIENGDATRHKWSHPIHAIAAETFLGPAMRDLPDKKALHRIIDEVNELHVQFLKNLHPQIKPGTKIALAVPAWYEKGQYYELQMLDYLKKMGYNPSSFVHVKQDMVYHRPQQVVGRRILLLQRK